MTKTQKQTLREHLETGHKFTVRDRDTFDDLSRLHARTHHQYWCNHDHAGTNLGPGTRPAGWYTGEDVVWKGDDHPLNGLPR